MAERALAHIEKIECVRPIEGADNIELIGVLGWICIAKKEFKPGDLAVYIEIDSKCPESDERFTFSSEGGCRYPKKYEYGEKQNWVKGFLKIEKLLRLS